MGAFGGGRGARRVASSSSGVTRRISPVTVPASTAVPTTRGVMSSTSSRPLIVGIIFQDVGARVGRGGGILEGTGGT